MPLPKPSIFQDWPEPSIAVATTGVADLPVLTIPVIHELGSDLKGGTIESTRLLPPSKRPVMIKVESRVVTEGLQRIQSSEYLATVRRRKSRALRDAIAGLARHAGREDFAVCTYPVLKQVNELLTTLNEASEEGNTREILRQLRNTLMNGGWSRYRAPEVRRAAVEILNGLAEAEEVLPQRVDESFDRLHASGLNPVGTPLFRLERGESTPDAEDEVSG
jgi:hypothetical protein